MEGALAMAGLETGQIDYINDSFFNLARQKTYGFDIDGKYDAGPWEIGAAVRPLAAKTKPRRVGRSAPAIHYVIGWSPTRVPMMVKSISRPFSFSTILGWPEVIWKFRALPAPMFFTISPSENGSEGSTAVVKGSSP